MMQGPFTEMKHWPKIREAMICVWHGILDYDRKIPAARRENNRQKRETAKAARLIQDKINEIESARKRHANAMRAAAAKREEAKDMPRENVEYVRAKTIPLELPESKRKRHMPSKNERVSMTKKQSTESAGIELIELCRDWMEDGKLDERELAELRQWLFDVPDDALPAIRYLKEEIRQVLADGRVDEWEMDRIHLALLRTLPKEEREAADSARNIIRRGKLDEQEAIREGMRRDRDEYWKNERKKNQKLWSQQPATEAQIDFIIDLGGSPARRLSKLDASFTIDRLLGK